MDTNDEKLFTEEDMKLAIKKARMLEEPNQRKKKMDEFDINSILGFTEITTSTISIKYTVQRIIKEAKQK